MCNILMNCAFYDKSTKLCTQSEYTFKNIIGYRDITDLTCNKNDSAIFKMAVNNKMNLLHFLKQTHGTKCMENVVA